MRRQVGLFGKVGCGIGITLHGQVIQNQGIDVAADALAAVVIWYEQYVKEARGGQEKEDDILFPHYIC